MGRGLRGDLRVTPGFKGLLCGRRHRLVKGHRMSRKQSQGQGRALLCFPLLRQDPADDLSLAPDAPGSEGGLQYCTRGLDMSPRALGLRGRRYKPL